MKASSKVPTPLAFTRLAGVSVASTRPESMSDMRSQRSAGPRTGVCRRALIPINGEVF
jgi:hypothetical protein